MRRATAPARTIATALGVGALLTGSLGLAPISTAKEPPVAPTVSKPAGNPAERGRWQLPPAGDEQVLSWRSPVALPLTDARAEFRVGGALLGYPQLSADRRTLTLAVDGVEADRVGVWLSGRRLDVRGATGPQLRLDAVQVPPVGPTVVPAVDPGEPGALSTTSFDYTAASLPWREFEGDLEVVGHVVRPDGVVDAPLVLFLHGRHQACFGGADQGTWPCTGGSRPVPSHLGYDYLQRLLASQGYATVSIAANGVNQQDWISPDGGALARSALVRHHLRLLAQWSADAGRPRWFGRLDTSRTVLVGHSRGGEGVNQAAVDTRSHAPYRLVGQTLIAPTDFGFQTAGYLPTVTLLPYCDGDVYDLQGQRYVDAAATLSDADPSLRSSVLMRGANHNFYNTEWTPRLSQAPSFDDWGNDDHRLCGSDASETRLSAGEQRRAARTFIGASVAAFVDGDQAAVDIVDAALPVRIPAAGDAVAWTHAIGGNRTRAALGDGATTRGDATACRAVVRGRGGPVDSLAPSCAPSGSYARPLHWIAAPGPYASVQSASLAAGAPRHLRLSWTRSGGSGGLTFGTPLDLSAPGSTLDLRVLGDPEAAAVRFAVRLVDSDGDPWSSPLFEVAARPGRRGLVALHAQTVRVRTGGVSADVDLASIAAVELVPVSDSGSLWVLDASARRLGLAPVPDVQLPSVSLGRLRVSEGDSPARRIAQVPFSVNGDVTEPASFGVSIAQQSFGDDAAARTGVIELLPGDTGGLIRVPFKADTRRGMARMVQAVFAVGLDGVTMHTYVGRLTVVEDDPYPSVELQAAPARIRYGDPVRIEVELSEPMSVPSFFDLRAVRVPGTRALSTDDVPRRWLERYVGEHEPGRPLADFLRYAGVYLEAGQRRGVYEIPTLRRRDQGPRTLGLRLAGRHDSPTVAVTVH